MLPDACAATLTLSLTMCRDEDHLALFVELLGPMPRRVWGAGRLLREFLTCQGTLCHIRKP